MKGSSNTLPEEYIYYLFADEFGWTPSQLDEQDVKIIDILLIFINTKREAENKSIKKHKK